MDGIVTLLQPEQEELVQDIWRELREECGLGGIEIGPIPHFSWIVAERFHLSRAGGLLEIFARNTAAFTVRTVGLGLFVRPDPVIYLPLVKNKDLLEFHAALWADIYPLGSGVNLHYDPESWMPHITLALWDLTPDSVQCALSRIMTRDVSLEILVDNLAVICQEEGQIGAMRSRYSFTR
jgi:2'-5' RNA ligase